MTIEDCVIIGGGVAGLSAANRLVDSGRSPLIIEGGVYPCQRICGEYFSHESLPILQKWNIPIEPSIENACFIKGSEKVAFKLPVVAGSCSRFLFDEKLFDRAIKLGARALCKTVVESLELPKDSSGCYELKLSDNQVIKARHLIIGTGKLPKTTGIAAKIPEMKYYGLKAHFEGIPMGKSIEMQAFTGGYFGMANVDEKTTNIAILVRKEVIGQLDLPELLWDKLLYDFSMPLFQERIKQAKMLFPKWLVGQVPEFGIRKNPEWERVFWVGDAAGGIPPISGQGLAIAVTSGVMAANYLMEKDAEKFRKDWLKRYQRRFFWAKQLHRGLLHPTFNKIGFKLSRLIPALPLAFWRMTRE